MLELRHVGKTFNPGTVNEKVALQAVDLHLDDGDFATIVGSNGTGKSTLFNAIAGAFVPDTGTITLDGQDITFQPDYRRSKVIGRMFQDPLKGTAPHMTIEENLSLAYLRASRQGLGFFSRVNATEKRMFRDHLALLGMGLTGVAFNNIAQFSVYIIIVKRAERKVSRLAGNPVLIGYSLKHSVIGCTLLKQKVYCNFRGV